MFFLLRSFTVGCGKSIIFASPVLFLLFSFFLLLFSVIFLFLFLNEINDDDDDITRSSAVAKRPHDASFLSVCLFSSAYSSMPQAVTNKHSLVRRRLCDLHCMVVGNCFLLSLRSSHASSNRSIASVAWPTMSYTQLCRR